MPVYIYNRDVNLVKKIYIRFVFHTTRLRNRMNTTTHCRYCVACNTYIYVYTIYRTRITFDRLVGGGEVWLCVCVFNKRANAGDATDIGEHGRLLGTSIGVSYIYISIIDS